MKQNIIHIGLDVTADGGNAAIVDKDGCASVVADAVGHRNKDDVLDNQAFGGGHVPAGHPMIIAGRATAGERIRL